jgi:ATP-binding cassette subfamily F protein 3
VLSGGERGRYALLRLLLHPANFLLLDEPTNHLDLRAKDVLLEALVGYTGTVVFVSHDRYFIDKLATRVFEVGDGKVEIFPGNYEDYLWRKQGGQHETPTLDDVPDVPVKKPAPTKAVGAPLLPGVGRSGDFAGTPTRPTNGDGSSNANQSDTQKKRLNPLKRKQMEDRIHELEEKISEAEDAIARLEAAMQNFVSPEESQRQAQELEQHKANHCGLIREWEELSQELTT